MDRPTLMDARMQMAEPYRVIGHSGADGCLHHNNNDTVQLSRQCPSNQLSNAALCLLY